MSDELKDMLNNENNNSHTDNIVGENEFEPMSPVEPISEQAFEKAEKIMTDNDDIAALNKEALGQLESPLIVHKKTDASYDENATAFEMSETHVDEDKPTLTRHRFKKDPKKMNKGFKVLVVIFVILAGVFAGLYFTGNLPSVNNSNQPSNNESTTAEAETTTSIQQKYEGTIVIKDNYIFVDGTEVDGINGLQEAIKYTEASTTAYKIIIEGGGDTASDYFYNYEVYPLLLDMGFIDENTEIQHVQSTGLVANNETTTKAAAKKKKSKSSKKKATDSQSSVKSDNNDS